MTISVVSALGQYFPEISNVLSGGLLVFARMVGFLRFAPVFNRKEIPGMVKVAFALLFSVILVTVVKPGPIPAGVSMVYGILVNIVCGALIGFLANCLLTAIEAGGDMINMQMGLQSATVLDPTSQAQTSIMGKYFLLLGTLIFIHIGGVYWLIGALVRSFEIFPMYATSIPLDKIVNLDYVIELTSNILYMGLQIASPILIATLGQDIILGIISKTAPQINVFQLSFLFKPVLGAAILIWILPALFSVINDYFVAHARIF